MYMYMYMTSVMEAEEPFFLALTSISGEGPRLVCDCLEDGLGQNFFWFQL